MARWVVSGYEGTKEFFRTSFGNQNTNENDIKTLMQRLTCKFLTALEIVECTPGYLGQSNSLDVQVEVSGDKRILTIGNDRISFKAFVLEADETKVLREVKYNPPRVAGWEKR